MHIAILLSTYNGGKYLKEQIESIIVQTNNTWKLYIRDDGSTDKTIDILNDYVQRFPNNIYVLNDTEGNLKSAASFMKLLDMVEADYYMFCDQDDVWMSDKIERTLNKIKATEDQQPDKAVLVFTDLNVVDANLQLINKSMWEYSNINPDNAKNFYTTTCLSSVTGCTIMINSLLKKNVLPYPKTAKMHDWWISLNAAHNGIVGYINEPTILYRQHGNNVLGAEAIKTNYYTGKLLSIKKTIKDNIEVYRMLKSLKFNVNLFKVAITKIKIIVSK